MEGMEPDSTHASGARIRHLGEGACADSHLRHLAESASPMCLARLNPGPISVRGA